jgi:Ni,Fe-hydrogenase III large subunit
MHQDGRREITKNIKHGVTSEQVISLFEKIRNDSSFSTLRKGSGSMERLAEIENQFSKPKIRVPQWR